MEFGWNVFLIWVVIEFLCKNVRWILACAVRVSTNESSTRSLNPSICSTNEKLFDFHYSLTPITAITATIKPTKMKLIAIPRISFTVRTSACTSQSCVFFESFCTESPSGKTLSNNRIRVLSNYLDSLEKLINCCKIEWECSKTSRSEWCCQTNLDFWSLSVDRIKLKLYIQPTKSHKKHNSTKTYTVYVSRIYLWVKWSTSENLQQLLRFPWLFSTKNQNISKMCLMVDAKSMCGVRFFVEYFCQHTTETTTLRRLQVDSAVG